MKVKELIERLKKLNQEKEIVIETAYSNNYLGIEVVIEDDDRVIAEVDDTDFDLDADAKIEYEIREDEMRRQEAIDRQIDEALGK